MPRLRTVCIVLGVLATLYFGLYVPLRLQMGTTSFAPHGLYARFLVPQGLQPVALRDIGEVVDYCYNDEGDGTLRIMLLSQSSRQRAHVLVGQHFTRRGFKPDGAGLVRGADTVSWDTETDEHGRTSVRIWAFLDTSKSPPGTH